MSWYCGWDGGGTKTGVCALDAAGSPLAEAAFGPLNPNGSPRETVENTVADCLRFMAGLPGGLEACGGLVIGFAGASNIRAKELIARCLADHGYTGPLRLLGDQEIALAGAIEGPGCILIAGTGSVCFGRDAQGQPFRSGGYGYLIDDGGSGYAIGRDILTAVVRAADGREPETCLTAAVYERLALRDIGSLITWLYSPETGKKQIAALAPLLLPALEDRDEAAGRIVCRAVRELSDLALAAWKKAGMTGGEIALLGSIMQHYPMIRQGVCEHLTAELPGARIIEPRGSAALGAAQLARKKLSPPNPRRADPGWRDETRNTRGSCSPRAEDRRRRCGDRDPS